MLYHSTAKLFEPSLTLITEFHLRVFEKFCRASESHGTFHSESMPFVFFSAFLFYLAFCQIFENVQHNLSAHNLKVMSFHRHRSLQAVQWCLSDAITRPTRRAKVFRLPEMFAQPPTSQHPRIVALTSSEQFNHNAKLFYRCQCFNLGAKLAMFLFYLRHCYLVVLRLKWSRFYKMYASFKQTSSLHFFSFSKLFLLLYPHFTSTAQLAH